MRARRSGFGTSVRKSRIEPMCTRICSFQTQVLVLPQGRVFRTATHSIWTVLKAEEGRSRMSACGRLKPEGSPRG